MTAPAPVDVLADLRALANVGEYRELTEAMERCLRPHERGGFAVVLRRMPSNVATIENLIEKAQKTLDNGSYEDFQELRAALAGCGGAR